MRAEIDLFKYLQFILPRDMPLPKCCRVVAAACLLDSTPRCAYPRNNADGDKVVYDAPDVACHIVTTCRHRPRRYADVASAQSCYMIPPRYAHATLFSSVR